MSSIDQAAADMREWSSRIFPQATLESHGMKLIEEVCELFDIPEPSIIRFNAKDFDLHELADVALVLVALADLAGYDLGAGMADKLAINKQRTWVIGRNGTHHHD